MKKRDRKRKDQQIQNQQENDEVQNERKETESAPDEKKDETEPEQTADQTSEVAEEAGKKHGFLWRNRHRIEVLLLVCGLLACAVTLAYFVSRDEVSNPISGFTADIELLEPEWDSVGETKAQDAEPGMQIEKDPYVKNNSNGPVYVRMKIKVMVWDKDEEAYIAIDDGVATGNLSKTYAAVLQALEYEKPAATGTKTAEYASLIAAATYASANPAFYLDKDGWFYYATTAGDPEVVTCTALSSGDCTKTLFDIINFPNQKTDYNNGVFDKDFRIDITAQAIAADKNLSFAEIQNAFNNLNDN